MYLLRKKQAIGQFWRYLGRAQRGFFHARMQLQAADVQTLIWKESESEFCGGDGRRTGGVAEGGRKRGGRKEGRSQRVIA